LGKLGAQRCLSSTATARLRPAPSDETSTHLQFTQKLAASVVGKDLISTTEWNKEQLDLVLALAHQLASNRFSMDLGEAYRHLNFAILFLDTRSTRTRASFEVAATELGGHAQVFDGAEMRLGMKGSGESVQDTAGALSRYFAGVGIRYGDQCKHNSIPYGHGNKLLREFAEHSRAPVFSMGDDLDHPCQALADIMTWQQVYGNLTKKKLLLTWAPSTWNRALCSSQASVLLASRYGMDICIANPEGYDMDQDALEFMEANCRATGSNFDVIHDSCSGYANADIVYPRHWVSRTNRSGAPFDKFLEAEELAKVSNLNQWTCSEDKFAIARPGAIFSHCMPVERGHEATDEVVDGPRSVMLQVAENRLHVQKGLMMAVLNRSNGLSTLEALGLN